MSVLASRPLILTALLGAIAASVPALQLGVADAAPNYYSQEGRSKASQLRVVAPRAGSYTAGQSLRIEWRKGTSGTEVQVTLFSATGSGAQGAKVRDVVVPASVSAGWKPKGGALLWTIPSALPPGRYLFQVRSGSYVATSDPFLVSRPPEKVPELGAEQLAAKGLVKKTEVEKRGAEGTVVIAIDGEARSFEWGRGACPELGGGLPGALAMMATLGDAEIRPRYREARLDEQVRQLCLVGLIAENKPVPGAD